MKMNKKDPSRHDSTTDFFLKFINKEKNEEEKKTKPNNHRGISEEYTSTKEKFAKALFKMINLLNTTFDKMLQSNLSIKILSFLLAVVLLFTVSGGSLESLFSTPNGGDYIKSVTVAIEGLQDDYDVAGVPETVNVGLIGPSLDIYSTKLTKNYEVYVDLSGLGEGEQTVELKSRNFPDSVEVMMVPQTITVTITRKVTKTFDLNYRFINEDKIDSKYSVSVNSLEHDKVEVRGSQDNIDKIYSVDAVIDLKGITDSFSQKCKVKAYDRSGKVLNVEIIPSSVDVDCSVSSYSKKVSLEPEFTGTIASGFAVEKVDFSKSQVRIYGDAANIKDIDSVKVLIDVNNLSSTQSFKDLKLVKDSNVNKMSFASVDGTVTITNAISKAFSDLPIHVKNNDQKYQISFLNTKAVQVTVTGAESKVNKLTNDDITVYVDVENLKRGRHLVPLSVELNDKSLNYQIDDIQNVSILIKK